MQSIIKPLAAKVQTLTNNLQTVIRGLVRGDPAAKKYLDDFCTSVSHIKADFKSAINSMYGSYQSSIATMAGMVNPMPMIKIIAFFLQEALAAVQLLNNLIKLLTSLLSVNTIISLIMDEINKLKVWLNNKLLWLTRALARIKQKIAKNIEWLKRQAMIPINRAYLNVLSKGLEAALQAQQDIQANLIKQPGINGDYGADGKTWIPYRTNSSNEPAMNAIQAHLDTVTAELADLDKEPDRIAADKVFWSKLWATQEAQDKAALLSWAKTPVLDSDINPPK